LYDRAIGLQDPFPVFLVFFGGVFRMIEKACFIGVFERQRENNHVYYELNLASGLIFWDHVRRLWGVRKWPEMSRPGERGAVRVDGCRDTIHFGGLSREGETMSEPSFVNINK
jgi:hypothetical protein